MSPVTSRQGSDQIYKIYLLFFHWSLSDLSSWEITQISSYLCFKNLESLRPYNVWYYTENYRKYKDINSSIPFPKSVFKYRFLNFDNLLKYIQQVSTNCLWSHYVWVSPENTQEISVYSSNKPVKYDNSTEEVVFLMNFLIGI